MTRAVMVELMTPDVRGGETMSSSQIRLEVFRELSRRGELSTDDLVTETLRISYAIERGREPTADEPAQTINAITSEIGRGDPEGGEI